MKRNLIEQVLTGELSPTSAAVLLAAVENPTAAQRKNLPDAAFALIVAGPPRRRVMPHHIKTVRNANENDTVDVPRLRNALARMNQLRGLSEAERRNFGEQLGALNEQQLRRVRSHINRHADDVLKGRQDDEETHGGTNKKRKTASRMSVDELLDALRIVEQIPDGFEAQALLMAKSRFHTKRLAQQWASDHDWNSDPVTEQPMLWSIEQQPMQGVMNTRTITIESGVQAVIGQPRRRPPPPTGDLPGVRP